MHSHGHHGQWQVPLPGQCSASEEQVGTFSMNYQENMVLAYLSCPDVIREDLSAPCCVCSCCGAPVDQGLISVLCSGLVMATRSSCEWQVLSLA